MSATHVTRARIATSVASCVLLAGTAGAQLFVDASNVPPGDGSIGDPFVSIQDAVDAASYLEEVFVFPGEYVESVVVPEFGPVQLIAIGGHELTTWRPPNATAAALRVFDTNFPTQPLTSAEGFTFAGTKGLGGGIGVATDGFGGQVHIERCAFTGLDVAAQSRYELTLHQCTLIGNGVGLEAVDIGHFLVRSTIVWENGVDLDGFGQISFSAGFAGNGPGDPGFSQGMVFGDPGLWDLANADWHIAPGSPCIDGGFFGLEDIGVYDWDPTYAPVETYCTGKLSSQGCVPAISATGVASLTSAGPFDIHASDVVELKNGLFFYGYTPGALPFFGGVLCTLPPNRRTGLQNSGTTGIPCSGTFAFDFQAHLQSGIDSLLVPGELAYGQYWFRDPADPAGFQVGLTNAVRFGIAP